MTVQTGDYVLDDVSLHIPQHKVTAIVGASGSGKTTLIKLMLGFYTPNKGAIKIRDTPLENINPHLWRARTGSVMQDGFIFSETIAQNIAVGEEQVDVERLAPCGDQWPTSVTSSILLPLGVEHGDRHGGKRHQPGTASAPADSPRGV